MNSQNRDTLGTSRRKSGRPVKIAKTPSNSPTPVPQETVLVNEVKEESDLGSAKGPRRSGRHTKPTAKILEIDQQALLELEKDDEVEVDEEYDETVDAKKSASPNPTARNSKNSMHHPKPLLYTFKKDLCEKNKPRKSNTPRPANRVYSKNSNIAATSSDGKLANGLRSLEREGPRQTYYERSVRNLSSQGPTSTYQNRTPPRTMASQKKLVQIPFRIAITPKHLLPNANKLKDPKEEDAQSDPVNLTREVKQESDETEKMESPNKPLGGISFSQLSMRIDRKTGQLFLPPSNPLLPTTQPLRRAVVLKTVSRLKKVQPEGLPITERTVTVQRNLLYSNKDGSAPGPSSAPSPSVAPSTSSPPKPTQPRTFVVTPGMKIVPARLGPDGKPIPTRRIVIANPKVIQKIISNSKEPLSMPRPDHIYCKPDSKRPMSPDRVNLKRYIPPTSAPPAKRIENEPAMHSMHFPSSSTNSLVTPQVVDLEDPAEKKPEGLTATDGDDTFIEQKVKIEETSINPDPNFVQRRMVLVVKEKQEIIPHPFPHPLDRKKGPPPYFPQHRFNTTAHPRRYRSVTPVRSPSPRRVFLGAQEPIKDLKPVPSFNRATITYVDKFTPKQLRSFGKRDPGNDGQPTGPGISLLMLSEADEAKYKAEKEKEEEEEERKEKERKEKLDDEHIRQKQALAQRITISGHRVWDLMQTEKFRKLSKPEDEMTPMERLTLQHDALANIPAYSETLSFSNPKLHRDLKNLIYNKLLEKSKMYPVRTYKKNSPSAVGKVCGPVTVDMESLDSTEAVDRPLTTYNEKSAKLLNVVWNGISAQVPHIIKCHLCEYIMKLCMRKSNYRGELREYPAYRCLQKGCQTFRSIKKYIEGTPVKPKKPKKAEVIEYQMANTLTNPEEKYAKNGGRLRTKYANNLTRMAEQLLDAAATSGDLYRKNQDEEENDEDDDELVEWAAYPGVPEGTSTSNTPSRSPSPLRELYDGSRSPSFNGVEEVEYEEYDFDRSSYEKYVKEEEDDEQDAYQPRTTKRALKRAPVEIANGFQLNEREIKEEIVDEEFDERDNELHEKKPEFLLENCAQTSLYARKVQT